MSARERRPAPLSDPAVRPVWEARVVTPEQDESLSAAAAAAIHRDGWRLLLGGAYSSVAVGSLPAAVEVAAAAVRVCGPDVAHLHLVAAAATRPGDPGARLLPASPDRYAGQATQASHRHPELQRLVADHRRSPPPPAE